MSTLVISRVGDFSVRIDQIWDRTRNCPCYKNMRTSRVFKTQKGAIKNAKKILKNDRASYIPPPNKVKRCRTKPVKVKRRRLKPVKTNHNVWVQMNIQEGPLL